MKVVLVIILAVVVVALLFTVVFPWVDRMLADPVMGVSGVVDAVQRL